MGLLDDLLPRRKEDEMMEVPEDVDATSNKSVTIRIETLTDFVDVDRVARLAKEGNIVFLRARELQRKDLGEFQNCVAKLKKVSNITPKVILEIAKISDKISQENYSSKTRKYSYEYFEKLFKK